MTPYFKNTLQAGIRMISVFVFVQFRALRESSRTDNTISSCKLHYPWLLTRNLFIFKTDYLTRIYDRCWTFFSGFYKLIVHFTLRVADTPTTLSYINLLEFCRVLWAFKKKMLIQFNHSKLKVHQIPIHVILGILL